MFQVTYLHKQILQYYCRHCCYRSHWHVLNFQNLNRFHFHFRNQSLSQNLYRNLNRNLFHRKRNHNLSWYLPHNTHGY